MENYEQKRIKKLKQGNIRKRKGGCQLKEKNKLMQDINFCTGINKNKKGVTLVALVVTIVVLLILAGVSIAMLSGDNGLIKQAQNASEEWEIAQDKEQLELAKQAEIAKGKGYIDVDDYFDRLENEGIVNDKDTDIVDNGDGTYDVTTENGNTFEVTPVPDEENAEDIEIDYVGQGEIVGPRINKINITEKTKTSISIEVITRNAEEGQYTYSYKKATDSSYTQAQTTANNTYTFTNLEENTKYDIKVKLETSEGSIEKTITVQTEAEEIEEPDPPEEETPEGTITFGTVTWSGGKASIQVSTTSGYEMEYQINGTTEGNWTSITNNGTIQNLTHGNTVNVRLVNGSKRGQIQSTTIQDIVNPTVTVTKGEVTTNEIAVTVQATDNESEMTANPTYTYFIKKTTEQNYTQKESNQTNNYTFTGLDQETSYDIKVEVQGDKAGNKGEGTLTGITTGKVTGGTVEGAITFGNPTWSAGQASITISTNTSYKIEYQLNGTEGSWTEISNNGTIQNLAHNTTIYARLTDGNNHGDHASTTIKDTVNPTVTIQSLTAEDTTIQVTAKGTDNETGINEYIYSIKESTQEDSSYVEKTRNTTGTATIEGMKAGKTYTVKVEITDKAGLTGSATKEIEIKKPAITNEEISNNPEKYYGKEVTNYNDTPNNASVGWQIFHADEENIYLIAKDYVHKDYIPDGAKGSAIYDNERTSYELSMNNVMKDYSGSSDITDEKIKELNNDYFNIKKYTSTNDNMKKVAYMLDTNVWSVFKGEQAEYAIGGPTIELLFESHNKRHITGYVAEATSEEGYQIKEEQSDSWSYYIYDMLNTTDRLYVISSESKVSYYWVASPTSYPDGAMRVSYDGSVNDAYTKSGDFGGFRPVVCLKSGVALEEQEDGTYHIIETVRSGKITFGEPTWEGDNASVTVSTNTNFRIEYQVNKVDEGSWTSIENNGTITGLKDGDTVYARLTDGTNHGEYASLNIKKEVAGTSYDTDTDIEIGGYPVTIPAGATISKIPGEYESVEDGVVIYITNGEEITNWNADTNSNSIPDVQENYDQFVWIPVDKESAIIEEGVEITGSTNTKKYNSLKTYVSSIESPANGASKYPMAVKITNADGSVTYKGILYDFEEQSGKVAVTPLNYTTTSSYREPAVLNNSNDAPDEDYVITESSLQEEYKTMIERVAEKGGFWVGRYETTNMNSTNFTTNAVNVVRGTTNGINNVDWYKMYEGQKAYKNSEQNISLKNSATTSSMIWGSQWDQIMIWMRGVENTIDKTNGIYYVTNAVGMGNYGTGDSDKSTSGPVATGKREQYKVKNVYDLAGNEYEWTLEASDTHFRVRRGASFRTTHSSDTRAIDRSDNSPIYSTSDFGSRLTLY